LNANVHFRHTRYRFCPASRQLLHSVDNMKHD